MRKLIWCKCEQHSWTRRQMRMAWENNNSLRCPESTCGREIPMETIEELLTNLGVLQLDMSPEEVERAEKIEGTEEDG